MIKRSNLINLKRRFAIFNNFTSKSLPIIKSRIQSSKLFLQKYFASSINEDFHDASNQNNVGPLKHQEILYKATPIWSRSLIFAITGSIGFGFLYACVARIDEVVIARGELQALGAERPIRALFPGVISLINIKEGDKVEKGQLLLQFDPDVTNNRIETLINDHLLEKQRKVDQLNAYKARELGLKAKLNSLKTSYEFQTQIVSKLGPLASEGAIPIVQYLREKNRLQENYSEIAQVKASLAELTSQASSINNTVQREISRIERQLIEARKISFNENLRSPVKGRVFDLIPASPGYIAVSGETLLKIVPDGDVEAKVFITNSDIGFVRPRMKSQIRVDAYPFTQFGHVSATLKSIGEEVLPADETSPQTRFPAYLKLESQYLKRNNKIYRLKPGQSISANLIVRNKPVISLLTDAVEKALDALRGIKS